MTFARSETFRSIGQILAADVLPALFQAQKLPLCISCLGVDDLGLPAFCLCRYWLDLVHFVMLLVHL